MSKHSNALLYIGLAGVAYYLYTKNKSTPVSTVTVISDVTPNTTNPLPVATTLTELPASTITTTLINGISAADRQTLVNWANSNGYTGLIDRMSDDDVMKLWDLYFNDWTGTGKGIATSQQVMNWNYLRAKYNFAMS